MLLFDILYGLASCYCMTAIEGHIGHCGPLLLYCKLYFAIMRVHESDNSNSVWLDNQAVH